MADLTEQEQQELEAMWAANLAKLNDVVAYKVKKVSEVDTRHDLVLTACVGARTSQYQRAEIQARAYKAAGYPSDQAQIPPMIMGWATASGMTPTAASNNIIAQADAWIGAEVVLYNNRLLHKENIRLATTIAGVDAAFAGWVAFETYMRSQLGV